MCKSPYETKWPHANRCPNLAKEGGKTKADGLPETNPVTVYKKDVAHFDSLAHFWAGWYKEYLEADFPRLIIRFEDLQFHAKEVLDIVCQCAGAVPREDDGIFRYVVDSAKWGPAHKSSTNMVTAMIKYGTDKNRFKGMSEDDMKVAKSVLTPDLMNLFGYELPP
jgi:hypothetical protein